MGTSFYTSLYLIMSTIISLSAYSILGFLIIVSTFSIYGFLIIFFYDFSLIKQSNCSYRILIVSVSSKYSFYSSIISISFSIIFSLKTGFSISTVLWFL